MPIFLCPSTYALHVQMKLPKHVLVQTQEINHELEFLLSMSRYLFCVSGHIRYVILSRGQMGMVQKYPECLIYALYVI